MSTRRQNSNMQGGLSNGRPAAQRKVYCELAHLLLDLLALVHNAVAGWRFKELEIGLVHADLGHL